MFCGNYILSNGSRWTFYFSKVFNLILQSANKNFWCYEDIFYFGLITQLGCIPFAAVLAWYRASVTVYYLMIPVVLLLLLIFTTGVSYAVSIWFVFQRDAGNIYSNFIFILRFFVAMFYSVDWVAAGVRWVIEHNPVYLYIYILRQCVVYGQRPEWMYVRNGVIWAAGMFVVGILIFKRYENDVVERL